MNDDNKFPAAEVETAGAAASVGEFPAEPFPCPVCGQMLAPSCRLCVACKSNIDPAKVAREQLIELQPVPRFGPSPSSERVPYPWGILFVVLAIGLTLGMICVAIWGEQNGPLMLQALPILAGLWVFFDASQRGVPRPWRWGTGTMLLLAVVFPWYLARRNRPQARAPIVETVSLGRILIFVALLLVIAALARKFIHVPSPAPTSTPAPKLQKTGERSKIAEERRWSGGPGRRRAVPNRWTSENPSQSLNQRPV